MNCRSGFVMDSTKRFHSFQSEVPLSLTAAFQNSHSRLSALIWVSTSLVPRRYPSLHASFLHAHTERVEQPRIRAWKPMAYWSEVRTLQTPRSNQAALEAARCSREKGSRLRLVLGHVCATPRL